MDSRVTRRSGQRLNRAHTIVMDAAITVRLAAAKPTNGWISCARITDDIANTNQPNAFRSASALIFVISRVPIKQPATAAPVTAAASAQSI